MKSFDCPHANALKIFIFFPGLMSRNKNAHKQILSQVKEMVLKKVKENFLMGKICGSFMVELNMFHINI